MSVIPCRQDVKLKSLIEEYAEALKAHAHEIGEHGLDEAEFYNSGLFRGAIERIRGQFSATMRDKRLFVRHVLNHLQDERAIQDWDSISDVGRHLYAVTAEPGRTSIIEVKGCLDGNNTNIFIRPPDVDEFVIWSKVDPIV